MKADGKPVVTAFTRVHTKGPLDGMRTYDSIRHVDRWHALQWLRGVRSNVRKGVLEYRLAFSRTVSANRWMDGRTGAFLSYGGY